MRLNRYIALAVGVSRRQADKIIGDGRVLVDNQLAVLGKIVEPGQKVKLDGIAISLPSKTTTVLLNKPVGIVVSRNGQGGKTIYDILPKDFANLKPIGRLDKNSSGLLLLTNNGQLANELTHPSTNKSKVYFVQLSKPITQSDQEVINNKGVMLEDGISRFKVEISGNKRTDLIITMTEGRNRQIRRTFAALGYDVSSLDRRMVANYKLGDLGVGEYRIV